LSVKNRLRIRVIKKEDCSALLKWANNKQTRNNSINRSLITKYQHKQWFARIFNERSRNPALICLKDAKERLGVIRFTRLSDVKNDWEIHFTVNPKYRGLGFAQPMLVSALGWFRQSKPNQPVYAHVKALNIKSLKVLRSIGFKKETSLRISSDLVRLRLPGRHKRSVSLSLKKI